MVKYIRLKNYEKNYYEQRRREYEKKYRETNIVMSLEEENGRES